MKYLSLFSGIEACTVAWEPLGWECVGVAEIEPFPCHVLHECFGASRPRYMPENDFKAVKNLPENANVINFGDVSQVTEEDIKNLGRFDVLVFGSPCQNLSVAGNRKGLQGETSGLFYEAIRLISYARKHCGLRFALWENVPGAFSSNKGDDFREVVRELSANRDITTPENGWGNTGVALGSAGLVEWRVLDAQYFGLAQRRKRVFAVVDFGNWRDRPPILLEPKSVCGNTPPSREAWKNAATDTQESIGRSDSTVYGLDSQQPPARLTKEISATLVASNYKEPLSVFCVHGSQDPITSETTANCLGRNQGQENVVVYPINTMTCQGRPSDNGRMGLGVGNETDPCPTLSTVHHHAVAYGFDTKQQTPKIEKELTQTLVATGYKEPLGVVSIAGNIIGRDPKHGGNHTGFDDGNISYTLTTADRHGVAYSKELPTTSIIRRLTPTECERLQGFPDDHTKIPYRNKSDDQCPDGPRYKALGNSMAVPVMRWIGEQISRVTA